MRCRYDSACGVILDGAGQYGCAALMAQHCFEQKCCCCFTVGSGYTAEFELLFGVSEEICRKSGQRAAPMRHLDHGYRRISRRGGEAGGGVSDDGSRALRDRLRDIAIAI